MENNNIQDNGNTNQQMEQDQIMNRVNQSYEKMVQDVKDMINKNNDQLS
jgi:hypothetical protein